MYQSILAFTEGRVDAMLTEREWFKHTAQKRRSFAECWGAQYVLPDRHPLRNDRAFRAFLLMLSSVTALLLPLLFPPPVHEGYIESIAPSSAGSIQPRKVPEISYLLPENLLYEQYTYARAQLLRGKMMLLDENHPLPADTPPPNTYSIAVYAKGEIPVKDLQIVSGAGTIKALQALFAALRQQEVAGLAVCEGTHSKAQQQEWREKHLRTLMTSETPERAAVLTNQRYERPGAGELLQEYTVEIRPQSQTAAASWQKLLQTAWRYGFIRTMTANTEQADYRFRWVGEAHATAMTYLNLSFREYLDWLHEKETIAIEENGRMKYLICCKPLTGTHIAFSLPKNAAIEVSLDNLGYAIAACTLP